MNTVRISDPRCLIFKWRAELTLLQKLFLAVGMAALTGLFAQIKIHLPFTPVPVTGQTLAVLLSGIVLGKNWGGISQVIYASLGVAGLPWFSGMTGGWAVMAGPTGGYILGFILAAFFLGFVTETYVGARRFLPMLGLMFFASMVLIFIPGLAQLGLWLVFVKGSQPTLTELFALGFFPFVIGDILKITLAAALAKGLLPKENH